MDHFPKDDEAKPSQKEPEIDNAMVLKSLEKLGKYKFDKELDKNFS